MKDFVITATQQIHGVFNLTSLALAILLHLKKLGGDLCGKITSYSLSTVIQDLANLLRASIVGYKLENQDR
jgi:hypothetical protein